MNGLYEINYYTYPNFDYTGPNDRYICELELVNNVTGNTVWKMYKARDKKSVIRTARGQATKFMNMVNRFYAEV